MLRQWGICSCCFPSHNVHIFQVMWSNFIKNPFCYFSISSLNSESNQPNNQKVFQLSGLTFFVLSCIHSDPVKNVEIGPFHTIKVCSEDPPQKKSMLRDIRTTSSIIFITLLFLLVSSSKIIGFESRLRANR